MNAQEELVMRCAYSRADSLGNLSDAAFQELVEAVLENPENFVHTPADQAFFEVVRTLSTYEQTAAEDEFLTDEQYMSERRKRLDAVIAGCERALAIDQTCTDARLIALLARDLEPNDLLDELYSLRGALPEPQIPKSVEGSPDAWDNVYARPALRVHAAITRVCLETTRYKLTCEECEKLIDESPTDALGARNTWALALARLEDEEGFHALEARFDHLGSAWFYLAHALLLYKLGRLVAAKRALLGFSDLCKGGAFVLLRPAYVDTYLPDRPDFEPGSFEEVVMAVHEADPIIVDSPDFIAWAQAQPGITKAAERFADDQGFDW